jgi:hypothetical protein
MRPLIALVLSVASSLNGWGEPGCPAPRATDLRVGPAGVNPLRVRLRVRAEASRGRVASVHWTFGGRAAEISDLLGRRRVATWTEHTYPAPGTYRVTVVAESSIPGCRRYRTSEPARLRVRVPVR